MRITVFVEKVEALGYVCDVHQSKVEVFRMYGKGLRNKVRVGVVHLAAPYHFEMTLDPMSAIDDIGDLIVEFGMTSLKNRGRLTKYSVSDGNQYKSRM